MSRSTKTLSDYPGRMMQDKDRTAFGLGWEYKRRGWSKQDLPLDLSPQRLKQFNEGYDRFICSDSKANAAMLRGFVDGEF